MRMFISSIALLSQMLVPAAVRHPSGVRVVPRSDSLAVQIARRAGEVSGAVIGVAFHDLQTSDTVYLNADVQKLPKFRAGKALKDAVN